MTAPSGPPGCPACERSDGVEQTNPGPRAQAWRCSRCEVSWAISVVNPQPQPEIDRLRWALGQVIALAHDAPDLTDAQLRDRLLLLAVQIGPEKGSSRERS